VSDVSRAVAGWGSCQTPLLLPPARPMLQCIAHSVALMRQGLCQGCQLKRQGRVLFFWVLTMLCCSVLCCAVL
jgi:hypothetical protein